ALGLGGEPVQTPTHDRTLVSLLRRHLGIVAHVMERVRRFLIPALLAAFAEAANGPVTGNRQYPACRGPNSVKVPGIPPDLQEHLVGELFCNCCIPDEPQDVPENADLTTC